MNSRPYGSHGLSRRAPFPLEKAFAGPRCILPSIFWRGGQKERGKFVVWVATEESGSTPLLLILARCFDFTTFSWTVASTQKQRACLIDWDFSLKLKTFELFALLQVIQSLVHAQKPGVQHLLSSVGLGSLPQKFSLRR